MNRAQVVVAGAVVTAAAGLFVAAAGPWGTGVVPAPAPLPAREVLADPPDGMRALAAVALAAVPALFAARGWLRRVVGLVLLGSGLLAGARALDAVVNPLVVDDVALARTYRPGLALVAAALVAACGAVVTVRGHAWPALGRRYEAPGASSSRPATDDGLWDALDRGEDPTR